MLVEVACRHGMFGIVPIEEHLPLLDGRGITGFGRGQFSLQGCIGPFGSLDQPTGDGLEFVLFKGRKAEGHALVRMLFKEFAKLIPVLSAGQVIRFRPVRSGALWIFHLVGQQLHHDRVIQAVCHTAVGNAEKVLFPPLGSRPGIGKEPGWLHGMQSCGVVNGLFGCAAVGPLERIQFELAGGVVAGVADRTALVENRFDLLLVLDRPCGNGERHRRQCF